MNALDIKDLIALNYSFTIKMQEKRPERKAI